MNSFLGIGALDQSKNLVGSAKRRGPNMERPIRGKRGSGIDSGFFRC